MDSQRFDQLTRNLATSRTRRGLLRLVAGGALGTLATAVDRSRAGAVTYCGNDPIPCRLPAQCCGGGEEGGPKRCVFPNPVSCGCGKERCAECEVCSRGSGGPLACRPANSGTSSGTNPCAEHVCRNGRCTHPAKPDGTPCGDGRACVGGSCVELCDNGQTKCPAGCFDTQTDRNHCGGCNKPCAPGEDCCNGVCVDPRTDESHCGGCDKPACASHQTCCEGACVDPRADEGNGGGCGTTCPAAAICSPCKGTAGACAGLLVAKCCPPARQTNCGGTCVNLKNDEKHCGKCGRKCQNNKVCRNGKCQ